MGRTIAIPVKALSRYRAESTGAIVDSKLFEITVKRGDESIVVALDWLEFQRTHGNDTLRMLGKALAVTIQAIESKELASEPSFFDAIMGMTLDERVEYASIIGRFGA